MATRIISFPRPRTHDLKVWPEQYEMLQKGIKPYEIRLDDRDYQVGDVLNLFQWDPQTEEYGKGGYYKRVVMSKLEGGQFGIAKGYCILGLAIHYHPMYPNHVDWKWYEKWLESLKIGDEVIYPSGFTEEFIRNMGRRGRGSHEGEKRVETYTYTTTMVEKYTERCIVTADGMKFRRYGGHYKSGNPLKTISVELGYGRGTLGIGSGYIRPADWYERDLAALEERKTEFEEYQRREADAIMEKLKPGDMVAGIYAEPGFRDAVKSLLYWLEREKPPRNGQPVTPLAHPQQLTHDDIEGILSGWFSGPGCPAVATLNVEEVPSGYSDDQYSNLVVTATIEGSAISGSPSK